MIVVVGTGRCGSSAVARVLQERLGVDMGGPANIGPATPQGSYEDPMIAGVAHMLARKVIGPDVYTAALRRYGNLKTEPWGFKHPATTEALPHVFEVFPDAQVVWAKRDSEPTIASWMKWMKLEVEEATVRVHLRHWLIAAALLPRHHLDLDLTERMDDDTLAREMATYLGLEDAG